MADLHRRTSEDDRDETVSERADRNLEEVVQEPRSGPDRGADPVRVSAVIVVPERLPDRRHHLQVGAGGGAGQFCGCRDLSSSRRWPGTVAVPQGRKESIVWLAHWMSMAGLALLVTAMTLAV